MDASSRSALSSLSLPAQFHVPASQFSGGWQMRIALARLLLGEAGQAAASGLKGGLMLLDEPTNHLDSAAIRWLGGFLRQSGGTLVVVSHDEALLDDVCDHIAEVGSEGSAAKEGGMRCRWGQRRPHCSGGGEHGARDAGVWGRG